MKWADAKNTWDTSLNEGSVKNIDELTYDYQENRCQLVVECSATIDVGQITLHLSSGTLDDEGNEKKLICNLNSDSSDCDVVRKFDSVLKSLIQNQLKRTCADST